MENGSIETIVLSAIQLAKEKARSYLEIKLPPRDFYPDFTAAQEAVLLKLGFQLKHVDVNSSLKVSHFSEVKINRNRNRDLKFWKNSDAIYSVDSASVESIYNCLLENRKIRKIQPSISLIQMKNLVQSLGSQLSLHSVTFENQLMCAGVVLQLDQNLQYIFMWGDNPVARREYPSPITFLLEGITTSLTEHSPTRFCLGTSSILGEVDAPLLRFKQSLGFEASMKPTYIISL
jgi:hypothetical protein